MSEQQKLTFTDFFAGSKWHAAFSSLLCNRFESIICLSLIDDTLTTAGKLCAQAYGALEALQRAGKRVIPVTGCPAGWCDHIARMWPVDGIINENGALYSRHDRAWGNLRTSHSFDEPRRASNAVLIAHISAQILQEVLGCAIASDQFFRQYDPAIDFCEDVLALNHDRIDRIVQIMEQAGMTTKISSIHDNG